ncbi:hypothetical protein [Methylobacterium sp. A49B]
MRDVIRLGTPEQSRDGLVGGQPASGGQQQVRTGYVEAETVNALVGHNQLAVQPAHTQQQDQEPRRRGPREAPGRFGGR